MPDYQPEPDRVAFTGDQHTIETPEQTPLRFAVAGVGSRFLALAIDTLIQVGIALGLMLLLVLLRPAGRQPLLWTLALFFALFFLLYFGYFAGFEILWNGQTPGKRQIGIRVVKDDGRPLSPAETIARNLLRIVDQLPGFYAVGIIVALLNAKNKRLGDLVAGSMVVRESKLADLKPVWQAAPAAAPVALLGAERLSSEDLALIDSFLNRRADLTPDVRSMMAARILGRLRPKLVLPSNADGLSSEAILESLAYEQRSRGGYV